MEGEEDSWARAGTDDEETLPQEQHAGKDAGGEKQFRGKTKKDNNCQSMMGPNRESCAADELEPVSCVQ